QNEIARSLLFNLEHDSFAALADVIHQAALECEPSELRISAATKTSLSRKVKGTLGLASRTSENRNGKLPEFCGFENNALRGKFAATSTLLNKHLIHKLHSSELLSVEVA